MKKYVPVIVVVAVVVAIMGVSITSASGEQAGQPAQQAVQPAALVFRVTAPADPGSCGNTDYEIIGIDGQIDGRNTFGFVRVSFDAGFTCIVIETVNSEVVVANPTKRNTPTGITAVDSTHYRVYGDGAALGGELSLKVKQSSAGNFSVVGTGTVVVVSAPATCANVTYTVRDNSADFGLTTAGVYFRQSQVAQWSSWEWAKNIPAGETCVKIASNGMVSDGQAKTVSGAELGVNIVGSDVIVYTIDGSELPPEILWSISNGNSTNLKALLAP